ncbi:MAG: hydrogenase nickel incorporation protein HypB [Lachnospiraceae bacterium]|nr:hydrogenase nickel incorporation protein HypB [Lachnospiraceae bacterium]
MNKREFDILETKYNVLADNDKAAMEVRKMCKETGTFLVNLMASPGAGKTTTLVRTIEQLKNRYRIGVMEADVDSDVDAVTVKNAGAKVIQLHTGGSCHMDADMTKRGMEKLDVSDIDILFLENVGNLVCPAEFDVGANKKVAILSVPEGDDKPLKYPLMFEVSDLLLVGKMDVSPVFDFRVENCKKYVEQLNPDMEVLPVSAKTGEGFDAWINWLEKEVKAYQEEER